MNDRLERVGELDDVERELKELEREKLKEEIKRLRANEWAPWMTPASILGLAAIIGTLLGFVINEMKQLSDAYHAVEELHREKTRVEELKADQAIVLGENSRLENQKLVLEREIQNAANEAKVTGEEADAAKSNLNRLTMEYRMLQKDRLQLNTELALERNLRVLANQGYAFTLATFKPESDYVNARRLLTRVQAEDRGWAWQFINAGVPLRSLMERPVYDTRSLKISADGKRIAASDLSGNIKVWNAEDGHTMYTFKRMSSWGLAFNRAGTRLATVSMTGRGTAILNIEHGTIEKELLIAGTAVAFSEDSRTLAIGDRHGDIFIVDPNTGEQRAQLEGHAGRVDNLYFCQDGSRLLSIEQGPGTCVLWDLKSGERKNTSDSYEHPQIALSPDRRSVLIGGSSSQMTAWNLSSGKVLRGFEKAYSSPVAIAISHDGKHFASAEYYGSVKFWSWPDAEKIGEFEENAEGWYSDSRRRLLFSPDDKYLAAISSHGRITIWDTVTKKQISRYGGYPRPVKAFENTSLGSLVALCGVEGLISSWNLFARHAVREFNGTKEIQQLDPGVRRIVSAPLVDQAVSSDGRWIARSRRDGIAVSSAMPNETQTEYQAFARKLCFSPNGRYVAGCFSSRVLIHDVKANETMQVLPGYAVSVGFSGDGKLVACGWLDATVSVHDISTGLKILSFATPYSATGVARVGFTPDDQQLVATNLSQTHVTIWGSH